MLSMSVEEAIIALVAIVGGLVGLIKGLEYLIGRAGQAAAKWLEKGLEPINKKLDEIDAKVDESEISDCKNYLVGFLSDVKRGVAPTEVERERFHETYKRYQSLGGNGYIHGEVERLRKEGKL